MYLPPRQQRLSEFSAGMLFAVLACVDTPTGEQRGQVNMLKKMGLVRGRPRVPEGLRVYAFGDVHGRFDLLDQVLRLKDAHLAANPVHRSIEIFLGDYIDRGPASREVLDCLIERGQHHEMICLKGNHETYIEAFLHDPAVLSDWRHLGGLETLLSYGVAPSMNMDRPEQAQMAIAFRQLIPESHLRFVGNLKSSVTFGDYFFVHAGVRPGIPLQKQRDQDLLWIRGDFLLCENDFGKTVVHGHTPVKTPDSRFNRINIDTGAYATGQLTCLILEGTKRDFIQSFSYEQSTTAISAQLMNVGT